MCEGLTDEEAVKRIHRAPNERESVTPRLKWMQSQKLPSPLWVHTDAEPQGSLELLFFCERTEIYNGHIAVHCEGIAEAFSIQIATKISRTAEKNVQPSRKAFAEMCNVSLPSISALCLVRIHPLNRKPGASGWLRDVVCIGGSNVNLENSTKIY